jgi:hypothetical protein
METVIWLVVILGGWFILNRWIFPKMGVQT